MATIKIKRGEFYELLWEKTMSAVMEQYGISYTQLKKLIKAYDIPVPPNGYWSQLRAGYTMEKIPFTENTSIKDMMVFEAKEVKKRIKLEQPLKPKLKETAEGEVDPDIVRAKKVFAERAKGREPKKLIKIAYESIDLNVSPLTIDRALGFMDSVFRTVKDAGGKIKFSPHSTKVMIDGEEFAISLREKQNRIEQPDQRHSWSTYDFIGSGTLIFKIGAERWSSREWSDTAYTKIEEKLDSILAGFREMAIREKKERADQKIRQQQWEEQAKVKQDLEKLRAEELARFIELKENSVKWENAQRIKKYLNDMEQTAKLEGKLDEGLKAYLAWARNKADWYDPLVSADDELLKEVDKDTMTVVKKGFW